jgi:hypothetical protein
MELDTTLREARDEVIEDAYAGLQTSTHAHYERAGEAFTRARLAELFDLVVDAIATKELAALSTQSETIASERFNSGFDISEVQAAFNSLEVAMWRRVVASTSLDDLAESIGLLSTVMGFAKDTLARKYISLASNRHVQSLDMSALFGGLSAGS